MKVSKHPEGEAELSRGGGLRSTSGWEGMMGGGMAPSKRSRTKKLRRFFFLALAGQEKKRGSKHESLNFFSFPPDPIGQSPPSRLPKWSALNVSARTDHSLLQCSHGFEASTTHRRGTSKPLRRLARKRQERLLFVGTCSGVFGEELVGRRLPETATMATLWLVRSSALSGTIKR